MLAAALVAPAAFAGPPYVTDDPVPTEYGHWEIYQYASGSRAGDTTSGEAGLDFNYGGGEQLQLTVVIPAAWQRVDGTHVGMGMVQVAAKWRFALQSEGSPVDAAFFPRAFLPTAGDDFGSSNASLLLPVWLGREVGPWYVFGGGGFQINPGSGNRDFWTGGLALTRTLSDGVTIGGEFYGHTADANDAQSFLGANLGVVWSISPHWSLIASGGPGLVHAREEGRYDFYVAMLANY